ncbi:thioredoxin fold domain-containing protein [Bdellovibrionota bacterium FG-2]
MRILHFAFVFSVLFGLSTYAADSPSVPDFEFTINDGILAVRPPKGHHFNVNAPARLSVNSARVSIQITPQKLSGHLPPNPNAQMAHLEVFICDEANTYCRKKSQDILVPPVVKSAPSPQAEHGGKKTSAAPAKAAAPHFETETGFYVNDPTTVFALAKNKKLPLMIDFFGIWCPPCNHLDVMVFWDKEFRTRNQKRFVQLKLDADQDEFSSLKNRYKIQGLPTVIFATSEGDEIFRIVGFHPLDEMLKKADVAYLSREVGFSQLEAQAAKGDVPARYKAAHIALDRDEPAKALEWLTPLIEQMTQAHDPRLADLYRARLRIAQSKAQDKKDDGGSQEALAIPNVLQNWLKEFPSSIDAVENYQTLADLKEAAHDAKGRAAALTSALALTDQFLASPSLALKDSEYTLADLSATRADILEKLGDKERVIAAYLVCAKAYEAEARMEGVGFAKGPKLEQAYCLGKAGETLESEAIYREGIRRFPREYTFYHGLAKLFLGSDSAVNSALKGAKKALPEAKRAVLYGYGNQRLKATLTLVRALEALHEFQQAITAVEEALKSPPPDEATLGTISLRQKLKAKAADLKKRSET